MADGFTDLRIWQVGYELLLQVYSVTSQYPKEERFALIQDTRRSANSVIANIAESHGRYFYKDKVRVLYISRGEAEETQSHLRVAFGLRYLEASELNNLVSGYEALLISINNQIRLLVSQSQKSNIS